MHGHAFGEPPRHSAVGEREYVDVAHLVPECTAPVKVARLARRRAIHSHYLSKSDSERAQSRHTHGSYCKILMVGIHLNLHRPRELGLVFLVIRGDDPLQLSFKVRMQQLRFIFAQPQHRPVFLVGDEVLVAIQKAQAVHRLASR